MRSYKSAAACTSSLDEEEKQLLQTKLKTKISQENLLILTCDEDRSQLKNKRIIIKRFFEILEKALIKPKVRKATKITKGANERRIQEKKKAGEIACWFESYAQNTVSFEKLEQELGKGAVKKLEKFIAGGYIRNIQIDREGNYIMITAPNRRVNEKIYITVTCPSCGAKNQVIKGRLSTCEYCGQRLTP